MYGRTLCCCAVLCWLHAATYTLHAFEVFQLGDELLYAASPLWSHARCVYVYVLVPLYAHDTPDSFRPP